VNIVILLYATTVVGFIIVRSAHHIVVMIAIWILILMMNLFLKAIVHLVASAVKNSVTIVLTHLMIYHSVIVMIVKDLLAKIYANAAPVEHAGISLVKWTKKN